jgi:hypothetical protein
VHDFCCRNVFLKLPAGVFARLVALICLPSWHHDGGVRGLWGFGPMYKTHVWVKAGCIVECMVACIIVGFVVVVVLHACYLLPSLAVGPRLCNWTALPG